MQYAATPGDILLYQSDQLVLMLGENRWAYTKLGRVSGESLDAYLALAGLPEVRVTLRNP